MSLRSRSANCAIHPWLLAYSLITLFGNSALAESGVAILLVDVDRVMGTVDKKVYGHFLEHINHSVVDGLFAEQIHGFSPRLIDMNGDLYPELLVAADFLTSKYFRNNGNGTFTDVTVSAGCGLETNGMGQCVGDIDRDGDFDWYVTSIFELALGRDGNYLYLNESGHTFSHLPNPNTPVADGRWGWGTVAVDLDHNGWLDLVENNGWHQMPFQTDQVRLFMNTGNLAFTEQATQMGLDYAYQGKAVNYLDYDRDGDMDLVFFGTDAPLKLFRNNHNPGTGHWLQVRLVSWYHPQLASFGMGSRVEVLAGATIWVTAMDSGANYLGNSEALVHVGLVSQASIDQLRVTWPNGEITQMVVPVDRRVTLFAEHESVLDLQAATWRRESAASCFQAVIDVRALTTLVNNHGQCPPWIEALP